MSVEWVVDTPVCSFREFALDASPEKVKKGLSSEPDCLADYIRVWVESEEGVRACLGDHRVFLTSVIAIINDWMEDPGILDYVTDGDPDRDQKIIERPVQTIFGEDDLKHVILDPDWFATFAFRKLHPRVKP
ncbi:hypothetical protein [Streptomyces umbrinus]|uniref:hypothetical protein n=1 Tax=Streptomyces umbrinus TaxID=67370 RepID=UPI0033D0A296